MYMRHFNFTTQPFRTITRMPGDFFVPYHQDVFGLLKEKCQTTGVTALLSDDSYLASQFCDALKKHDDTLLAINAFPKLSASGLLYKLNTTTKESKTRIQAIDAVLRQWKDEMLSRKTTRKVLVISHIQSMKANCHDALSMLLTRAQELDVPLSVVLMGSADQEAALQQSGLRESLHTHHTLRPLTCRESLGYVQAQCEAHGSDATPFTRARMRRMHVLTKGQTGKLNELAHLAMLAAWTERSAQVSPRHLRLAAGEVLPAKPKGKRLAVMGLFASVLFAACGWTLMPTITARLPVQLPVMASWKPQAPKTDAPAVPVIDNEVVNKPDAMHQLYTMWGYDATMEEALCQNAGQVNLMCKEGSAPVEELAKEGYPWIGEIKTGDHLNYVVVARVDDKSLDLLMNNRTWQVSRSWFNQHATGNYTQLHRLTPQGKDAVSAESSAKDLGWMDQQLSLALNLPETHTKVWTAELMQRTREFQQKMHLHVDGIAGEDTLMQLMRETRTTPSVLIQSANISATSNAQEKHS